AGVARPVLPVHHGPRPAIRPRGDARIPRRAGAEGDFGGAGMTRASRALSLAAAVTLLALLTAGCQQQMAKQPSFRPLQQTAFYDDGRASRVPPAGTVAQ